MEETKQFESASKWFKLNYPASWQVESEDGICTFTKAHDLSWAFQISTHKTSDDSVPDFNIGRELQDAIKTHPLAKIVALANRKAVYYIERSGPSLLYIWIIGGKRCKAFCSYTTDAAAPKNTRFEAAQQVVDTMQLQ